MEVVNRLDVKIEGMRNQEGLLVLDLGNKDRAG